MRRFLGRTVLLHVGWRKVCASASGTRNHSGLHSPLLLSGVDLLEVSDNRLKSAVGSCLDNVRHGDGHQDTDDQDDDQDDGGWDDSDSIDA